MATLREATNDDAMAVAQVHVRSWQVGYHCLIDDDRLDAMRAAERAGTYRFADQDPLAPQTLLAVEGERLRGFVTWGPSSDGDGGGEILALYVDPDDWGRGVGSSLLEGAIGKLRHRSPERVHLWVLEGNVRAERFYLARGWTFDGVSRREVVWGVDVVANRFSRELD